MEDLKRLTGSLGLGSLSFSLAVERVLAHLGEWQHCEACLERAMAIEAFPEEMVFLFWMTRHPLRAVVASQKGTADREYPPLEVIGRLLLNKLTAYSIIGGKEPPPVFLRPDTERAHVHPEATVRDTTSRRLPN